MTGSRPPAPAVDDRPDDAGHVELRGLRARRHPAGVPRPGRLYLRHQVRAELRRHLSVDRVVFREPIHVGELVTFQASVNLTGRTSMEIGVRVTTQDLVRQVVRHTSSCDFTMVAVGPDGRAVPAPPWEPRTPEENRRYAPAQQRRASRLENERAAKENATSSIEPGQPRPGPSARDIP